MNVAVVRPSAVVARNVAEPAASAVTTPFWSIEATPGVSLDHVTVVFPVRPLLGHDGVHGFDVMIGGYVHTAKYHDVEEEKGSLQPFDRTQLPDSYRTAFEGKGTGAFIDPFPIDDPARGAKKFVVAQIVKADDGGDYTLADFKNQVRDQLAQERGMRRVIDQMRKDLYVSVRI